jgi:hypothetical protein
MGKNHYIFALGKTDGDKLLSFSLSRKTFWLGLSAIFGLIAITAFFTGHGFKTLRLKQNIKTLEKDNTYMRKTISSWDERFKEIEGQLQTFQNKHNDLRKTAGLPQMDMILGKGGPNTEDSGPLVHLPVVSRGEEDLVRLESELLLLDKALAEVHDLLLQRSDRISHYPSIRPIRGGWISSGFGVRTDPFTGAPENHPGIDISTYPGTRVYATADGVIKRINTRVTKNKGYGKYVILDHGYGHETLYAHLSKVLVKPGQKIKRWDLIGLTGSSGKSTAPHLHYGIYVNGKARDPMNFLLE